MTSARPMSPDSGMPLASAFAVQMRSGTTSSWVIASIVPVRPMPACTSSATRRMPWRAVISRMPARKPGDGTMKPPSPWIGSMTAAATFCAPTRSRRSSKAVSACSVHFSAPSSQRSA